MNNAKSMIKTKKIWQLNNIGMVQASVMLSITAAAKLSAKARKEGISPLELMANILENAAKEGK